MKKRIIRDLIIIAAIVGAIWLVFSIFPILPDESPIDISVETEEEIGDSIYSMLIEDNPEFKKIENPLIDSAISLIENRLIEGMKYSEYDYNIILADNEQVNAFSMPGAYIIVCSGLLKFTDSPEELATVIAHEMGHVENRHVISRVLKEFGLALVTGGNSTILSEIGKTAASATFDRKQERQADEFALKQLENSRINPHIFASFFRRLNKSGKSYNENLQLFYTHPHNNARIRAALQYKLKSNFEEEKFNIDWNALKNVLNQNK